MKDDNFATPMLFPYEPEKFWEQFRQIVREEINQLSKQKNTQAQSSIFETPGLNYKPLFKIGEVCEMFRVSKPTIYDWIKREKLRPVKIRSRVYFLWNDIQNLINPSEKNT